VNNFQHNFIVSFNNQINNMMLPYLNSKGYLNFNNNGAITSSQNQITCSVIGTSVNCTYCNKAADQCVCPRCIKCHHIMNDCSCMPALTNPICDGCNYSKPLCHCTPAQAMASAMKIVGNVGQLAAQAALNQAGRNGLSTGPAFYNPSMLNDGTDEQKLARTKAIMFRNHMLGRHALDLYSPGGFKIYSKLWPGRVYVAYAHHASLQVYDHGVNVGRLDAHVANEDVPMGDSHLAVILKAMHDEREFVKIARFSPVRDI
jgi:hypothetical protein